ncbi:hypothetical protein ACS0TY_000878 [Phlomoides rotata]
MSSILPVEIKRLSNLITDMISQTTKNIHFLWPQVAVVRRRSQKLTDKITALQKLVSPYGKTDTASVLLEASISIKALQDQIKELFQLIPVQETTNMIREKGTDLKSRGLCLVPCVFLEELERQSPMHCLLQ